MNVQHFPFLQTLLATGIVTSPNYPDNYPPNLEKTETIQVEQGLVISLQFTAFNIIKKWDSTCDHDHLTITDGDGTTLLEKSCGSSSDGDVIVGGQSIGSSLPAAISTSNVVNLVFSTNDYDYFDNGISGWSVSWSAVTPGECQQCNLLNFSFPFNENKTFSIIANALKNTRCFQPKQTMPCLSFLF